MAKEGYHCYAPDWIGYGFSEKPQPDYDFSYTGTLLFHARVMS
jgi:pimeloyl-ACP methyl ester carboxylesterase